MKKYLLFFLIGLTSFDCRKKPKSITVEDKGVTTEMQSGLPRNLKDVNGYLQACQVSWRYDTVFTKFYFAFGSFALPGKTLLNGFDNSADNYQITPGNIDVGKLTFNNVSVPKFMTPNELLYNYRNSSDYAEFTPSVNWRSEGNRGFRPLDVYVKRGFPKIPDSIANTSIHRSGFTLNIDSTFANYDSLIVTIMDCVYPNPRVKKVLMPGQNSITFTIDDFKNFYQASPCGTIKVFAFSYSWQIINDQLYVFELSKNSCKEVRMGP